MIEGAIPTGSLRLDIALGIGGVPRGEFMEISGAMASGKTTLCQHIIAEAQKSGEMCAWIDTDHSLDPTYAVRCGVNPDQLYVSDPEQAEQALQIVESLASSGSIAVVVLDSATGLIPQEDFKLALGESPQEDYNRLLSLTLRKLDKIIHKNKTAIIFTNQIKTDSRTVYHDLAHNPARLALKLHAGLRLELHPDEFIKTDGEIVGNRTQVRIIKNRITPYLHRTGFDIIYNNGIDKTGEIFDLGIKLRIICSHRAEYSFKDQKLGTEQEEALIFLNHHQSVANEIEQSIRQKMLADLYPAAT